jgi:deoxycytidylate deaminase
MTTKQKITATIYDRKGRVLSVGQNSYHKTHPRQAELAERVGQPDRKYLHAEISALVRCRGKPHKIQIERRDKTGRLQLAKPCAICQLAIREAGIKFVEYSVGQK